MENIEPASEWGKMLDFFTETEDVFQREVLAYENELKTVTYLHSPEIMKQTFRQFLDNLKVQPPKKNISEAFRNNGNDAYNPNRKDYCEAARLYTEALYTASDELSAALAHANRAAALMKIGHFKEAFDDCKCAVNLGYPQKKLGKLVKRQGNCALHLEDIVKLKYCLQKIEESNLIQTDKEAANLFTQMRNTIADATANQSVQPKNVDNFRTPRNKQQKTFYSNIRGRSVAACEDIKLDEEVFTETAFCFVPIGKTGSDVQIDYHCHNCAETNIIPFPCDICRKVSYCSISCRSDHQQFHGIECKGYSKNLWNCIGIGHLAMRTLLVGYRYFKVGFSKMAPPEGTTGEQLWKQINSEAKTGSFGAYSEVLNLETNLEKLDEKTILCVGLTATMLTTYLVTYTNFFKYEIPEGVVIVDQKLIIAALLMRHIAQMISNAHTIVGLTQSIPIERNFLSTDCKIFDQCRLHKFAQTNKNFAAIFPKISLYNHSCEPNIRNRFNKNSLTVNANRDLKAGEEILNCYGPHYKLMESESRKQSLLAQYLFECDCVHCNQLTYVNFAKYHLYKCKSCKYEFTPSRENLYWWRDYYENSFTIKCPQCEAIFNTDWYKCFLDGISQTDQINGLLQCIRVLDSIDCALGEFHEIRRDMISEILENFFDKFAFDEVRKFTELSFKLLFLVENQMGHFSLEYVCASTYLLDLAAGGKLNLYSLSMNYYFTKIPSSFDVLSGKFKTLFLNYWKRIYDKLK